MVTDRDQTQFPHICIFLLSCNHGTSAPQPPFASQLILLMLWGWSLSFQWVFGQYRAMYKEKYHTHKQGRLVRARNCKSKSVGLFCLSKNCRIRAVSPACVLIVSSCCVHLTQSQEGVFPVPYFKSRLCPAVLDVQNMRGCRKAMSSKFLECTGAVPTVSRVWGPLPPTPCHGDSKIPVQGKGWKGGQALPPVGRNGQAQQRQHVVPQKEVQPYFMTNSSLSLMHSWWQNTMKKCLAVVVSGVFSPPLPIQVCSQRSAAASQSKNKSQPRW